ncbi:RIP metalloprotease RseP [Novosphingobium sp. FSY-8]|uniref:Zinc metalloprotease n=1 Tax=Novosphingobium ovatum TaxID=1908523 RepID=A0ABW9XHI9_9SPHN|nr:RIP metalloprotease RseP [Novosphingobium ovatum]
MAFALLLGPLVLVHELGHYWVGRWFGVHADAFSIGFGREIAGWTDRRGTRWKLSILPLGGYVQFAGDMNPASVGADHSQLSAWERSRSFHCKPLWQRFLIVLAGPATNLFVAVAIFAAFNFVYGRIEASPVIANFATPSAAHAAGLQVGDKIVAINGTPIKGFEDIRANVLPYPGETVPVTVLRDGAERTYQVAIASRTIRDEFGNESRIGQIGIAAGQVQRIEMGAAESVTHAFDQSFGIMGTMVTGIRQIVTGKRSVEELGGPVKIAKYSGQRLAMGWQEFVYFTALISINLAFINLLPIPALDGGHLAFYVAEAVRRKPLDARSQEWAFRTGMAFLLALMVFVTLNDILPRNLF